MYVVVIRNGIERIHCCDDGISSELSHSERQPHAKRLRVNVVARVG